MKSYKLFLASSCILVSAMVAGCGGGGSTSGTGGTTNPQTNPTVTSISPTSVTAGSGALTVTVSGTGFLSTTTVQVGGVADATNYVSATEVTATVTAQQLMSGGQLSVIALNGTASSGSGPAVNLQVNNPLPTITSLSPSVAVVGAAAPTIAVTGAGFVPTTVIDVNASARTTTFVSATQVNVTLTAADVAASGSVSLTAINAAPGGGTSTAVAVAVNNPAPGGPITISPTLVLTGTTTPTTVTVTGTNFIPASTVELSGVARATTYVSSTQLTFQLTVADEATSQQFLVSVMNPTPGGGISGDGILQILPPSPTPVITLVTPTQFYVGSGATSIAVYGSNLFVQSSPGLISSTSSVLWNGTPLTIGSYGYDGSAEFITATVPASLVAAVGTATVTVSNATSTPAVSNALPVTITNPPAPTLTQISPNTGLVNTATTVALIGTGFTANSTVALNGATISSSYLNSTELTAVIPASSIASPGAVNLTVTTPPPGGGTSAALPFTASYPPAPTLTSIYPSSGPINTAASLTLNGTGFESNSTVAINGMSVPATFVSPWELTIAVPASSAALPGNLNITVTTPAPGGGTTTPIPYTAYISIPNNDLVANPTDGLLYVSVPGSAGSGIGNSVVGIDPATGNTIRQIFVGSNPNKLALSSDGTQLFVGLDGAAAVAQVNLTTGQVVDQFSLGGGPGVYNPPYTATYLAAVPGAPNSVAVAANGSYLGGTGVTIYDSGVARANTSSSLGYGEGPLAFGSSASTLYMAPSTTVYEMTVGPTGITGGSSLYSGDYYLSANIQYDSGQLYLSNGAVVNATNGALLGMFYATTSQPATGPIVSDSTLGLAFIGGTVGYGYSAEVMAFNESTFNPSGNIPFNGPNSASLKKIVRWGQDGLALIDGSEIYIFQSPVVKDLTTSPADLSVSLSAPATAATGSAITYTAKVTNQGPNQAQGATLALTLDPSLIVNNVTASQGSCGTGSVFSCDLGSLANGASATVTVSATPTTAGSIESTALVSSVSYDPTPANDQSTATSTVTGSFYGAVPTVSAISPALVQAGSGAFTLTVTGSGFNAGSTVNLNGSALTTTYVSATQLTANVDSAATANYGWAPVTVTNPSPGGGISQVAPLTIYGVVNVPANAIVFDPYSQQVYASVPSASTTVTGNSIVAINPYTAAVGTPIAIGSQPTVMAETTDGNYLWVGLNGANSLAQFDLVHQQVTATIPITTTQEGTSSSVPATWLAAMPGSDSTLAMGVPDTWGTWGIFDVSGDTGSFRPGFSGIYSGVDPIFASATEIYAYDSQTSGGEFYRYSVNASGVTLIDGTTLDGMGGFGGGFVLADGIVYGGAGGIINPSTTPPTQIATLPPVDFYSSEITDYGVAATPDPSTQKEFTILENAAGTWEYALARYDTVHYLPEAWVLMPTSVDNVETDWTMLRWGQSGLALLAGANTEINSGATTQILLIEGPFVTPQLLGTNSAASLTSSSVTAVAHGAGNMLLTLTGANFAPGVAVTWNGNYRTTNLVSPTQVTVAIPASDLASAGSGTLVATNPGGTGSNSLTVTIN